LISSHWITNDELLASWSQWPFGWNQARQTQFLKEWRVAWHPWLNGRF
jgi:hypothetical protein